MPIYEYVCKACGTATEIIHKISDPPERRCPSCGKLKLTKLVSAAAFRLKGAGWYETDFKSGDKKNLVSDKDAVPDKAVEPAKSAAEPVKAEAPAAQGKASAPAKPEKKSVNSSPTAAKKPRGKSGD